MALGAARSQELAEKVGDAIGKELAALGINTNFAPYMDVNNNPDNQAIADHFGPVDVAVRAVKAGVDIVLMPIGLEEVTTGVLQAVTTGEISEKRIDSSVRRILTMKVKRGIFKEEQPQSVDGQIERANAVVGSVRVWTGLDL